MKLALRFYGDPILRRPTERVEAVDERVRTLIADMLETVKAEKGIGLAAPQVGRTESICVIDMPEDYDLDDEGNRLNPDARMPLVLINPEIIQCSKRTDIHEEGCLSFPGIRADIERPIEIVVRFQDEEGRLHERTYRAFLARVIQHEVDHLNGVLFIDRMSTAKRFALAGRLRKLKRETEERLAAETA